MRTDTAACSKPGAEIYNIFGKVGENDITQREINKEPTERADKLRDQFLYTKSSVNIEFTYWYTRKWYELEGDILVVRRAEALKSAFEHLTPVIYPGELLVMGKCAYLRGSHPLPWLVESFLLDPDSEASKKAQKSGSLAAGKAQTWGQGGGNLTKNEGNVDCLAGKFGIRKEEVPALRKMADMFVGRSVDDIAHKYEQETPHYIEKEAMMRNVMLMYESGSAMPQGRETGNYYYPLQYGIGGMMDLCNERATEVAGHPEMERLYFYRAVAIVLRGLQKWILNYAEEAEFMASLESDEKQKKEYLEITDRLKRISSDRPRDFKDALQLIWIFHIAVTNEDAMSGFAPGRWGQVLYPYWKRDFDKGVLTEDETIEWLECMRIKFTEIDLFAAPNLVGGTLSGNTFNNMSVGGLKKDATHAVNELEHLIIKSGITCETTQPTLTLNYDEKLPEEFLLKAVECIKSGCGYPAIVNNQTSMDFHLQNYGPEGLTVEEARAWAMGGCLENSPGSWMPLDLDGEIHYIPGGSAGCAGVGVNFISLPKILTLVLFDGMDINSGERIFQPHGIELNSYENLWKAYQKYFERATEITLLANNIQYDVWRKQTPSIVNSMMKPDCLIQGKTIGEQGTRYNATFHVKIVGNQNLVNSMAALKKNVFEDKLYTMDDYKEAIKANFGFKTAQETGAYSLKEQIKNDEYSKYERIHKKSLDAPKFGNDDPYVDSIFKQWQVWVNKAVHELRSIYDKPLYLGQVTVTTHGPLGAVTPATPDGRLSGTSFADGSVSAYPGTDKNGPYALFNSASCWDHSVSQSSQLNMKVHPSTVKGRDGAKKFLDLIRGYMRTGAFHIQFNIVDSRMLRDAQLHPEKYVGLMVRVAGFTQYWAEIGKQIQDEIIARTEYQEF